MSSEQARNLFISLWDFIVRIFSTFNEVWIFMTSPYQVGRVSILGWTIIEGVTITPLYVTGGLVILIIGIGLVALFMPTN